MIASRKLHGAALAVLMAGTALPAAADTEITFSHFLSGGSTESPNVRDALARFQEKYPDVTLDEQIAGTDEYLTQFAVGAASGEVPDVFMMNGSDTTGLVAAGLVADITDDFEGDPEWGGITPEGMTFEFTRDGRVYGVPYGQIITHVVYWNEDKFAEAGIDAFPSTWSGFMEAVEALKAAGITPIGLGNKGRWVVVDPLFGTLVARQCGPDYVAEVQAGDTDLMDACHIAAIETFEELVDAEAFNPNANSLDNKQQRDLYLNGEVAMFIEGSWALPTILDNGSEEVIAATNIALWPAIDGKEENAAYVTGGAGWSYAIAAALDGEEREAAINLIKELSGVDYNLDRVEIGLLPAQALGDRAAGIESHPLFSEMVDAVGSGAWEIVPIIPTNMPRSQLDITGEALQDLMVGNRTPQEVAQAMQDDYDRATRE